MAPPVERVQEPVNVMELPDHELERRLTEIRNRAVQGTATPEDSKLEGEYWDELNKRKAAAAPRASLEENPANTLRGAAVDIPAGATPQATADSILAAHGGNTTRAAAWMERKAKELGGPERLDFAYGDPVLEQWSKAEDILLARKAAATGKKIKPTDKYLPAVEEEGYTPPTADDFKGASARNPLMEPAAEIPAPAAEGTEAAETKKWTLKGPANPAPPTPGELRDVALERAGDALRSQATYQKPATQVAHMANGQYLPMYRVVDELAKVLQAGHKPTIDKVAEGLGLTKQAAANALQGAKFKVHELRKQEGKE